MSHGKVDCGGPQSLSALVNGGAYHLRSTKPVTVYQFNPLEYQNNDSCTCDPYCHDCSFTNDASLLLPVNALGKDYYAASWSTYDILDYPGLVAITATEDSTEVRVVTTTETHAGNGVPAFEPGVQQTLNLNSGDVVQLLSATAPFDQPPKDLTGSYVLADKPVQVIAGHYCTLVPYGVVACDHLEESMFPVETLSTRYVVTSPAVPTLPNGKVRVVRIVATHADTVLTFDPPQANIATQLEKPGDFMEIPSTSEDFSISADHKILVAEYMTGQEAGGGTGDPAMSLAVPVDQYRLDYQFHAPVNYEEGYVNVVAPTGARIELDGEVLTGFAAIGGSGFGVLRVELDRGGTGDHRLVGDAPFGISVYGYGDFTSYWYPGGLDLAPIIID
jgi:hypothetical protein